jgi:hypothetical protein
VTVVDRKFNSKAVTRHVRELGEQADQIVEELGEIVTRNQALAMLIWKMALGYEEKIPDPDNEGKTILVRHKPERWAIEMLYDRQEGKTPQALDDGGGKMSALDKVSEIATRRLNALATKGDNPPPFKRSE